MNNHAKRLIIDGNNFIFRAFFTKRPEVLIDGFNTTPLHQFLYMLKNMAEQFEPKEIILTWDEKLNHGGENFRKNLVAYKEQRVETEDTKKIFDTIQHIKPFTDSLGIRTIFPFNLEADDIIAWLCLSLSGYNHELDNIIVSSDKDLLQLISENTSVYSPNKKIVIDIDNFQSVMEMPIENFLLYKTILGDVSDNIKGLYKYGPVKTKKLVEELMKFDSYKEATNLLSPEQMAIIERNLQIVDLNLGYPLEENCYREQYTNQIDLAFDGDVFNELCRKYNFNNYIREIGSWRKLFGRETQNDMRYNEENDDNFNILDFISI